MDVLFKIKLPDQEKGLSWALLDINQHRRTGLLAVESSVAGMPDSRKEIIFQKGEPIAVSSNRNQEKLSQHLLQAGLLKIEQLDELVKSGVEVGQNEKLIGSLMQRAWVDATKLPEILGSFFQEKLFSILALRRGVVEFHELAQLPENVFKIDEFRLTGDFKKLLWEEIKEQYDEGYCRSRYSKRQNAKIKLLGEFVLPLAPAELRVWNQMLSQGVSLSGLDLLSLQMLVIAGEFGLISWGESSRNKLESELRELSVSFKKSRPWEILGVARDASASDCKKAYLQLVKKFHPDRLPKELKESLRVLSENLLAQVNEAHDIWADAERREDFEAEEKLKEMGGMAGIERKLKAEMRFNEAIMAIRRKQYAPALSILKEIEKDIDIPDYPTERVYAELMCGLESKENILPKIPDFHRQIDKVLKQFPRHAQSCFVKAWLHKVAQQENESLMWFEKALEIEPNFAEAGSEARLIRMRREKLKSGGSSSWFKKDKG